MQTNVIQQFNANLSKDINKIQQIIATELPNI